MKVFYKAMSIIGLAMTIIFAQSNLYGQCTSTLDWTDFKGDTLLCDIIPVGGYNELNFPITVDGVSLVASFSDPDSIRDCQDGSYSATGEGGVTGTYALILDLLEPGNPGGAVTHSFVFDSPVENLNFSMVDFDIDLFGVINWQDSIQIQAFLDGVPVTLDASDIAMLGALVSYYPSNFSFAGQYSLLAGTVNRSVEFEFNDIIDSLVVIYSHGPKVVGDPIQRQFIGITDFSWSCVEFAPEANDDYDTTTLNTPVNVDILANDTDGDNNIDPGSVVIYSGPSNGGTVVNPDGTVTYTPDANFAGDDLFEYIVCDSSGTPLCDTATVFIHVIGEKPVAIDDTETTEMETTVTVNVLDNDSDPDNALDPTSVAEVDAPSNGTTVINLDGSIDYTPDMGFVGIDTFTYVVCDVTILTPLCDTAQVIVTVTPPVDEPPFAVDDFDTTAFDTPVTIDVLANDSDPENNIDTSSLSILDSTSNGTLVVNGDGTITYTPDSDFIGIDTFQYQICDLSIPTALCDDAIVVIVVEPCDVVEIDLLDCLEVSPDGRVCVPLPFNEFLMYDVFLNGTPFVDLPGPCDIDTLPGGLGSYNFSGSIADGIFATAINQIVSWEINGVTTNYNFLVSNLGDVQMFMDSIDPSGNWNLVGNEIRGGVVGVTYGPIDLFAQGGAVSEATWGVRGFANGTEFTVEEGCNVLTFVDPFNPICRDSIIICRGIPQTTITASEDTICPGESVTLTATDGLTWDWSTGDTTASILVSPGSTTTYTVISTNGDPACADTTSIEIVVNPDIEVNIVPSDSVICDSMMITLDATTADAVSYLWNTGADSAVINVFVNATSTYMVTVTNAEGCVGTDEVTFTLDEQPELEVTPTDTSICAGSDVTLTATANMGAMVIWSTGDTSLSVNLTPSVDTVVTAIAYSPNGCHIDTISVNIEVDQPSSVTIQADTNTICSNEVLILTANITGSADSILWSTGATTISIIVGPDDTTIYSVVVGDGACSDSDTFTVNVLEAPIVSVFPTQVNFCDTIPTDSITITASISGATSFVWSTGDTTLSIKVLPVVTTTYTVTATAANGCEEEASATVNINDKPETSISASDSIICSNETAILTVDIIGSGSVLWSTGQTTESIVVSPDITTLYTVIVTSGPDCSDTSEYILEVLPAPEITIEPIAPFCGIPDDSITIIATVNGADDLLWSTGDTTNSITVLPAVSTIYTLVANANNGCVESENVVISILENPEINIVNNDTSLCSVTTLNLVAETDDTTGFAVWSTGDTALSISVSPNVTTVYTVTYFAENGCEASDNVTVSLNESLSVEIEGDSIVCSNESATLTAVLSGVYDNILWSTGEDSLETISVNPMVTTTYNVIVSAGSGCIDTAEFTVEVIPAPIVTIDEPGQIFCSPPTDSLTFTATITGATDFVWSTGDSTLSIMVLPVVTTIYTVTATADNGCTEITSVTVTIAEPAEVEIIPSDSTICSNESATLTADISGSYASILWSTGEDSLESITVNPSDTTLYSVIVTTAEGCSDTAEFTLNVLPAPTVTIDPASVEFCGAPTDSITFTATITGATEFVWNTGDSTLSITVLPETSTTYTLTATADNGCQETAEANVFIESPVFIDTVEASANQICSGESVSLTVTGNASGYLWSDGQTGSSILVSPLVSTTYTVVTTGNIACPSDSASISIVVLESPTLTLSSSADSVCGSSVILTATTNAADSLIWSTGETTLQITVSPLVTTTYSAIAVSENNCSVVQEITVVVDCDSVINEINTDTVRITLEETVTELCLTEEIEIEGPIVATFVCQQGESVTVTTELGECVTLTIVDEENFTQEETLCVIHCNEFDECDTTIIIVSPVIEDDIDTITIVVDQVTEQICLSDFENLLNVPNGADIFAVCGLGEVESIIPVGEDNFDCLEITVNMEVIPNSDTVCVVHCNSVNGICDTTIIILQPLLPEDDTVIEYIKDGQEEITVCLNNEIIDLWATIDSFGVCDSGSVVTITEFTSDTCIVISIPTNGDFTANGDQICVFHCSGRICDTTTIILLPGNPPIAVNDEAVIEAGGTEIEIAVLVNDSDPDGNEIVITEVGNPVNGNVDWTFGDSTITYVPNQGFSGVDSFFYVICDVNPETQESPFHGCDTAWVFIEVSSECFIPKGFSPNGDLDNEFFEIGCLANYIGEPIMLRVYNRWGNEVYASDFYDNRWDGTFNGKILPDGTYYYILKFDLGEGDSKVIVDKAGFVVIHR